MISTAPFDKGQWYGPLCVSLKRSRHPKQSQDSSQISTEREASCAIVSLISGNNIYYLWETIRKGMCGDDYKSSYYILWLCTCLSYSQKRTISHCSPLFLISGTLHEVEIGFLSFLTSKWAPSVKDGEWTMLLGPPGIHSISFGYWVFFAIKELPLYTVGGAASAPRQASHTLLLGIWILNRGTRG